MDLPSVQSICSTNRVFVVASQIVCFLYWNPILLALFIQFLFYSILFYLFFYSFYHSIYCIFISIHVFIYFINLFIYSFIIYLFFNKIYYSNNCQKIKKYCICVYVFVLCNCWAILYICCLIYMCCLCVA